MTKDEFVRIEIGLHGGEVMFARVPAKDADDLERRLRGREDAVVELAAEESRYLVVLSRVLYVKRFARDAKVGFTSA